MPISNIIAVDYDKKRNRLLMSGAFHLLDIFRSFPSRRFEPKSKTWAMPLVKQNVLHWQQIQHKYEWDISSDAAAALDNFEKLTAKPAYLPIPVQYLERMRFMPLEHQWPMLDRGWNLKAYALIAAMGTGKTYVTIATAMARFWDSQIRYLMVISPQTLHNTWEKEFKKWAPADSFEVRRVVSGDMKIYDWLSDGSNRLKVILVSVEGLGISEKYYETVCGIIANRGHQIQCTCDESSRIKNPDAKRTARAIVIGNNCAYRTILNGTPIAKGIHDLWAQYEFLDPNIIGSGDYWAFKTRYVIMGGYENKQIIGYSKVDELMDLIGPYTLEVNKSVLNLPPKLPKQRWLKPTAEQERLINKVIDGGVIEGEPFIKVQNTLERMLRIQQIVGGFEPITDPVTLETKLRPLTDNPKLQDLLELIDDHRTGYKFIIWARFVPEIELLTARLREKLGDSAVVTYYGGTSDADRAIAEDRYCNDPTCRVVVGNPAAAGLGLTFISGENDLMYYYSGTFAYIDRSQSEDRPHRIGQTSTVTIVDPVMEGTLDETIVAAIAEKKDMDTFVKERMAAGYSAAQLMRGQGMDSPPAA